MRVTLFVLAVFMAWAWAAYGASLIATIEVETPAQQQYGVPLNIQLDTITDLPAQKLKLLQSDGLKKQAIPFQLTEGNPRQIIWISNKDSDAKKTVFELHETDQAEEFPSLSISREKGLLIIGFDKRKLLGYQFEWLSSPMGVDPAYGRNAFIHPLWSPGGQVLTRIQPKDHYHHYGIWNPWTRLEFDGKEYDLWNLANKQGTVRFARFDSENSGAVYGEYATVHEHVAFIENDQTVVVLNELQTVRVYRPHASFYYLMDMAITLSAATEKPVKLLKIRYGGFGWRTTGKWHKGNSEVLSSEGKDRSDVDNTLGRWFYVQGEIDHAYAGALVMSHPDNFSHPEPIRIWPLAFGPRGEIFASFSPTRNTDWLIEPGKQYLRTYRFLVYNGHMDEQDAEAAWRDFSRRPSIKVKPAK